MQSRNTPGWITELRENQVFVFGSNLSGIHGAGAARMAHNKFGAEWGIGEGLTGRCYAFPTKAHDVATPLTWTQMRVKMSAFWTTVDANPAKDFFVTEVGTGLAGQPHLHMALLFSPALLRHNVYLSARWWRIISEVAAKGGQF